MSLSYSLAHVPGSTEDVTMIVAEKASLPLQVTTSDEKGGSTSTYILNSGDPTYPATITYRTALNNKRADGVFRRIAITLKSWACQTDSVTGLDEFLPIEATISVNVPQGFQVETADLDLLLSALYSYTYASVTTKVRSTTLLGKLLYGVSQVI
jgi:hypothetical protein